MQVDRRDHTDTGIEQLANFLPTFRMPAPRWIPVSQTIDEHDLRMTRENRINIHFFKNCAFVLDFPAGNGFHLLGKFFNTFASVGFDETDDYILATAAPPQSFT